MSLVVRRIHERRAVFEAYLLALCVVTGLTSWLVPDARARSIISAFPEWAQGLWYVTVTLGGALGILGITRRAVDLGLVIERSALWLLAGLTASYGVASVGYAGPSSIPAMATLLAFTGVCVIRIYQINTDLAAIALHVAAQAGDAP